MRLWGVEEVLGCLGMSPGLSKCGVVHMAGGGEARLPSGRVIAGVREGQSYRCLGIHQRFGACLKTTKARVWKEYTRWMWKMWGLELAARQAVQASNK